MGRQKVDTISHVVKSSARKPASSTLSPEPPEIASPLVSSAPADLNPSDRYEALFPEPSVHINPPSRWMWWTLFLAGLILVGGLAYQTINTGLNSWLSVSPASQKTAPLSSSSPTATPATPTPISTPQTTTTPAPTSTPAQTPPSTPTINKADISIRVLNGTTTSGAAYSAKVTLEKAGFSVQTLGNARQQSYNSTVIYYQTGHQSEAALVQSALSGYSTSLEESDLASPNQVLVVVGYK